MLTDYAALYDLIRANGRPPHPRTVFDALGYTKREYYAGLRWLESYRFITRNSWDKRWQSARINVRLCACGTELTVANATPEINKKGYRFIRRDCRACIQQRQTEKHREWSARNPGYYSRVSRRARKQHRSASA